MKLPRWAIEWTGHTMISRYPPWIIYRPDIHRVRGEQVRRVLDTVRSGDILLRRFDGYLNTILTKGYYSHAGIFVGGNQVVHAVSQGTIQEDILDFCRADAVCVLGVINVSHAEVIRAVSKAIDAADANIDYDFDFSSLNETYYCTELIDMAYNHIFYNDYVEKFGQLVLMPDGIRNSKRVQMRLEVKP